MKKICTNKFIILAMIILVLGITGFFLFPKITEKISINRLEKEIKMTMNYLDNQDGDIKEIKDYFAKSVTSGNIESIEISLETYLSDVLDNTIVLKEELRNKKTLFVQSKDNLKKDLDEIKVISEKLNLLKGNYESILLHNYLSEEVKEEKNINLYHDFIAKINLNTYIEKINEYLKELENNSKILEYLKTNEKTWNMVENNIEFIKRKNYNEFNNLMEDNQQELVYNLVNDSKGPVITASNITVTKGSKIDLQTKFKCVDAVDDVVTCNISGKYDTNKVGTYKINISAVDTNQNKTNKTINLIVKEKVVNKKPYYIEVIRNQNVVIVYGLDDNNEYKKIVKVFVCSVGLNGKTPTGTFKTSDKSSWGWLSGNVYGQYYTRITGNILFHSVPYYKKAKNELEWEEYNKLGTAASKGCVRLSVADVKWIYNNCPKGTTVKIYDGNLPSGVTKPKAIKIDGTNPNRGWDPTDPDKNNPWKK